MTVPWSLTTTAPGRIDTTIGIAEDQDAAVTAVLAAAHDAIDSAGKASAPMARYELRAVDQLVAIVQTGADDDCTPGHASTNSLIQRIEWERYLSASPY